MRSFGGRVARLLGVAILAHCHNKTMRILICLTAVLTFAACAHATLIVGNVEDPDSVSFAAGGANNCSTGPTTAIDAGFSISTDGPACFPYSAGWSFLDNGQWFSLPALADNSGHTTVTINLGGSFSAAWGFMDYFLDCSGPDGCSYFGNDPTVTALDKNGNVIETADIKNRLDGSSSGDFNYLAGDTVGFTETTSDIAYLQISGDLIAITDISRTGEAPEPATLGLCGIALVAMGVLSRRRCSPASSTSKK
jgi:hypothetical protein